MMLLRENTAREPRSRRRSRGLRKHTAPHRSEVTNSREFRGAAC